jgi:hypothetical protein
VLENDRTRIAPVEGEELRPALAKLWAMLIVCLLFIPIGVLGALAWWNEVEIIGGKALSTKAGIACILAIPVGLFLSFVIFALLASAKRLVIGKSAVQLLSRDRVVVHIPYKNVAETYAKGESGAGVVGLRLRDRQDSETLVPFWTKDKYEIQVLTFGKPLEYLHKAVEKRLAEFRASARRP